MRRYTKLLLWLAVFVVLFACGTASAQIITVTVNDIPLYEETENDEDINVGSHRVRKLTDKATLYSFWFL